MSMLPLMGWQEILARIFQDFTYEKNASPPWLVNPATRRKLKLDYFYPEIGFAVRFVGLKAKGQRRKSDWEVLEEQSRDEIRRELCRQHDVTLVLLDPFDPYPQTELKKIRQALGEIIRRQAKRPRFRGKADLMRRLEKARKQWELIHSQVKQSQDLVPFAEAWRDREAQVVASLREPGPKPRRKIDPKRLYVGQRVKHTHFGVGQVRAVTPREDDVYVTIDFVEKGEKTFALSLLAGKLLVARRS